MLGPDSSNTNEPQFQVLTDILTEAGDGWEPDRAQRCPSVRALDERSCLCRGPFLYHLYFWQKAFGPERDITRQSGFQLQNNQRLLQGSGRDHIQTQGIVFNFPELESDLDNFLPSIWVGGKIFKHCEPCIFLPTLEETKAKIKEVMKR